MRKPLFLMALAALIAPAVPAQAVQILGQTATDGNVINVITADPGRLEADFDLYSFSPISLDLGVTAGDSPTIAFNSFTNVFTGVTVGKSLGSMLFTLDKGATFDLGSVTAAFSFATASLNAAGNELLLNFNPGESYGFGLGAINGGLQDFGIKLNGLNEGDSFTMTLNASAVPEPAVWLQMILGFALVGGAIRYRRNKPVTVAA